ncbi:hemerythrin domain-containing protein [Streptomyces sp. NBC_01465]|uniref:hemerythrin domain-containing protein n=1 Tax=Streptomyces sp. NBC_01465 TaxID=2903878 RepID=UPI003FCE2D73
MPTPEIPAEIRTLADKLVQVHSWLREQLEHVRTETEAHFAAHGAAPAPPPLGLQIRQRCLAFCDFLTFHHTSEDGHILPVVGVHHPELGETLDRLREEHRTIARVKEQILALLDDWETADPQLFRTELARMTQELLAHLDYEEEMLLPALAQVPFPPRPQPSGSVQ